MKKKNWNVKTKKVNLKNKKSLNNPKTKKLYKLFRLILKNHVGKNSLAVAVSGGADSLCLAYFSKLYTEEFKNKIYFFIVDHKLRTESAKESLKVQKILAKQRIKSKILTWTGKIPKKNIQSNAREIRYSLISKECYKNNIPFLVVGHHQDDQVENFLIRLFRGSGLYGLSSMSEKSNYKKNLTTIRPLLYFNKSELIYVTKKVFNSYISDPSNKNENFLRVRIRKYRKILDQEGLDTKKILNTVDNLNKAKTAIEFYKKIAMTKHVKLINNNCCILNMNLFNEESDEVIFRLFSDIFSSVAKSNYPPRSKKIINLIQRIKSKSFKKSTLAKCSIEKLENHIKVSKVV